MRTTLGMIGLAAAGLTLAGGATQAPQRDAEAMTFFVTSTGPGKGGDLGGLAGADAHCQKLRDGGRRRSAHVARLPQHAGARADNPNFVNARDRIGNGPWQNVNGVVVARSVDKLHSRQATSTSRRPWTKGQHRQRPHREANTGRQPTSSRPDGTAFAGRRSRT